MNPIVSYPIHILLDSLVGPRHFGGRPHRLGRAAKTWNILGLQMRKGRYFARESYVDSNWWKTKKNCLIKQEYGEIISTIVLAQQKDPRMSQGPPRDCSHATPCGDNSPGIWSRGLQFGIQMFHARFHWGRSPWYFRCIFWLVLIGGLEHGFYDFPFSWECHHPNWRTHIFQRIETTNTHMPFHMEKNCV